MGKQLKEKTSRKNIKIQKLKYLESKNQKEMTYLFTSTNYHLIWIYHSRNKPPNRWALECNKANQVTHSNTV
jgi:hypothetical protein